MVRDERMLDEMRSDQRSLAELRQEGFCLGETEENKSCLEACSKELCSGPVLAGADRAEQVRQAEIQRDIRVGSRIAAGASGRAGEWVRLRRALLEFLRDETGIGVIEIVLILVVLIGLVIIFKTQINELLSNIFEQIESLSESVY